MYVVKHLIFWKILLPLLILVVARVILLVRRYRHFCPLRSGSVVLITGAGRGIGLEFAHFFSRAGCYVVLVGRDVEGLRAAQASCLEAGAAGTEVIVADLSTAEGTDRVVLELQQLLTTLSLEKEFRYLVLNAGHGAVVPFSPLPTFIDVCRKVMEINYFANVRLLQQLLPLLEGCHSTECPSRVIAVSSLAGVLPSTLRTPYAASKHALQGFVNTLRGETAVHITLCCPGYVDTDFHRKAHLMDEHVVHHPSPRRGISPAACVQVCMDGALHSDPEVIMTLTGKLGYILRPVFTRLVDARAKKVSLDSLQGQ
ncbi:putative short chain dehydrogenase Enoyl (Acyl carrier protein) reductase [Trypanosoma vivax]|uniref:Putative short-chain dehydrogenase n=1 Tax=Trypanosoma vivax (strain Y486) TaxID=1055687 RepID=G0UCN7_TRYVY|nr:putative short chain dehydrogenase Enoyl (Acyl carrier protein) reductase [Trypanosoma vivax]CCC53597.1 putative short-chain dehydrogenase [Trypanosoma vivax Y486]